MSSTFDSAEINSAALQFALAKHDSAAVSLSALTCHACQQNVFIAGKAVQANLLALPLTRWAMVGHGGPRSISFNHHIGASAISLSTAKGCSSSPRFGGKGLASPLCAVHFLTVRLSLRISLASRHCNLRWLLESLLLICKALERQGGCQWSCN